MSLCINPNCQHPENSDTVMRCQSCGSELLLEGRYRVTRVLSDKGGFGKTYEVIERDGTFKVLKVLKKNNDKAVELFQREAKVLSRLNHPGIPQGEEYFVFYPHNIQEPVHCLVMEKVEGENLHEWLEKRNNNPITEKTAIDWLTQLANTLHELHQQQPPLIHRDIKPSNIMLKPDGQLVLIDFGTAREVTETYIQQQTAGQITRVVTDGYSPLEQVTGSAVTQSDFFALGRTFVHLLTGIHPLDLCDQYNHDLYTDELEDWRQKAPQISTELADFIDKLMARPVKKRPANIQEILQNLEEITKKLYPKKQSSTKSINTFTGVNLQKIKFERYLGDLSSRHSDAVNCLAISSDGKILVSGSRKREIKIWNLDKYQEIHTITDNTGSIESLAIFPDNENFVSCDGRFARIRNLNTGKEVCSFVGHSGLITSVAILPNGKRILTGSVDKTIRQWNAETGLTTHIFTPHSQPITHLVITADGQTMVSSSYDSTIVIGTNHILPAHKNAVSSLAISPDMKTIVSAGDDEEIKVWNMDAGELIHTLRGHSETILTIVISPDGKTIASGGADKTIKLWNLSSGEEITSINAHIDAVTCLVFSPNGKNLISGSADYSIKLWQVD
ncbi:MAG TPA: serine/threonine-protein kinase [Nostocaceae cyanobacterium]|nr:serine/threonine-protein kinase [Nostocaceae cyanobacterium]